MEYLIAVTLRGMTTKEHTTYRVPCDAALNAVVNAAVLRSNLPDTRVVCTSVEILGTLDQHLGCLYVPLLQPNDATDMVQP